MLIGPVPDSKLLETPMKILRKISFCILSVFLLTSGCAEPESEVPPVLSILEGIEDLNEQREALEMQKIRDKTAADQAAGGNPEEPATSVPPDFPLEGKYVAKFETATGEFIVEVDRSWAPVGADRFYKLVKDGFYDEARFFRVVPGFMVQWGLAADPAMTAKWNQQIQDDQVIEKNTQGFITFAKTNNPNSRTGQVFINYGDNRNLDSMGFAPFGKVTSGMDVVTNINSEYGEDPNQGEITAKGNAYLNESFPRLSFIKTARIISDDLAPPTEAAATSEAE